MKIDSHARSQSPAPSTDNNQQTIPDFRAPEEGKKVDKRKKIEVDKNTLNNINKIGISDTARDRLKVSTTKAPAPSPITNPSLSLSNGLEAFLGLSFLVDSAFIAANPPIPAPQTADSAPTTKILSAPPKKIVLTASFKA